MMNTEIPRVVFFAMRCPFSAGVLRAFLNEGGKVAGIALAAAEGEPIGADLQLEGRYVKPGTIEAIAKEAGIPVRPVRVLHGASIDGVMAAWKPDLIAVACFPEKLPPALLASPPLRAVNVHPSLLPRHRGPDPLFWTFRDGDERTGVTVHLMTDRLDAGPIVAQREIEIPFGIEGAALEARLAETGGSLLFQVARRRVAGNRSASPQDETHASVEGLPNADELVVRSNSSGRWAFAFVRGVASLGYQVTAVVEETGERIALEAARAFAPDTTQRERVIRKNNLVLIQFPDGICEFSVSGSRKKLRLHVDSAG